MRTLRTYAKCNNLRLMLCSVALIALVGSGLSSASGSKDVSSPGALDDDRRLTSGPARNDASIGVMNATPGWEQSKRNNLISLLLRPVRQSAPTAAVLTATKTDNLAQATTVNPGDTIMYTVVITNTGNADATNVNFTDTIDPNTTLVGGSVNSSPIAFDDSYTASGNIPIAPATSVLANDIDPDTGNNTGLTVTQVQGSGANVGVPTNTTATGIGGVTGSVTLLATGTFTYEPPPGFTGSDTFTYQISDAGGKTGTGTVTIVISNMVWFIDNTSAAANSRGTFSQPFKTIANFNTVNTGAAPNPQPGHHIVLRPAAGTYNEADGINLRDNQTLTGSAVAFNTVFTADANSTSAYTTFAASTGTAPTINATAGNGVDLASGNAVRGLSVGNTPGFFGFNGTAVGTLTIATVSKTGTGGAMSVSTSGTFGATVNFGTLESTSSATSNLNLVGVTGTLGLSSAGTGFTGSAAASAAINISGGSVSLTYPGNVTKANAGALLSVSGGHTGTFTFNTGTLSATSGTGLQFDNADGTYNFNGTTTLNGGDAGVDILNGSSGTFSFSSSTTITSPTGTAFNVNSSSPTVTYSGSITQNTASQRVINIDTTTSNTITFQTGTITGGASSTGININAANGNVTFSNGMTLGTSGSRMTNQALTITGGTGTYSLGAVSIFTSTASGIVATNADGTINCTSASVVDSSSATAINITGPGGLTSLGMTLTSVSSSGGTGNGIILSNTNGSFTINGTGSAASGGTIANKTGADGSTTQGTGIFLNNATNISLAWMQLNGFQNYGIRGTTVTGFTLDNTIINGTNGTTAAGGSEEGAVRFDGLVGSATISNSTLGGVGAGNSSFSDDLRITNSSGNLNRLTVTNVHFGDISTGGNNGLTFVGLTSAVMNLTVQDSFFTNAIGSLATITPSNNAAMDLIIRRNKFSNNNVNQSSGGGGLAIQGGAGAPTCTYDISCNKFRDSIGIALLVAKGNGSGAWTGDIIHNTIGVTGVSLSGSTQASGIKVKATGTNTHTVMIRDNDVRQYNENGIFIQNNDGSATLNVSVFNNITAEGGPFTLSGLDVDLGALGTDTSIINVVVGSAGTVGDKNDLSNGDPLNSCDVNLSRIAGAGTQLNLSKNGSASVTAATVIDDDNLNPATTNTCVSGTVTLVTTLPATPPAVAACTLPSGPVTGQSIQSAVAENTAESEEMPSGTLVVARGENPVDNNISKLTQEDLNWMVQAALARWVETGISTEDFARLQAVTFEVADLPNSELASTSGTRVRIDETAAGYGWFFDQSPAEDGEFQVPVPGKELQTRYLSPARDKMDLLTVVMRQLGEVYFQGKDRLPKTLRHNLAPMMEPTLSPGVRRLPLDQFRITPPTTGSIKPAAGGRMQTPTTAAMQASAAPSSTGPAGNQAETETNLLEGALRLPGNARYAVFKPGMDKRTATDAAVRFNNASDARSYEAIRTRRVGPVAVGAVGTVNIGPFTLPVGKSVTIMFSVTVNAANTFPPGTSQVCNQGFVSATGIPSFGTTDPGPPVVNGPTCTLLNVADVSVTKSAGSSPVCSTSNITFTINYNNAGPAAAVNAVVSDAMPAGTSLVSVTTPATWSRTDSVPVGGNGTITFSKASSPNADAATFTIVVSIGASVADGAVIQNTASVTSSTPDTNNANNTSAPTSTTVKKPPTTASVGGAQSICALGTTASLGGNTPTIGTGTWTVQSGGTGTFNPNATTPGATFTHATGTGPIVLRWTIANPPCTDSFAEVTVTVKAQPTATAGGPQTICALGTTASLGGNTPSGGATGTWSIVTAGVIGTFNPNANTPGATFTHTSGGIGSTITLRWTVSNPPCSDATADVAITIKSQPTATAGGPQTICAGGTTAGLGGNTPAAGETGTWSIVTAGVVGTFNPNANTPNATFTHTSGAGPFTLRWTVSNPPCTNATADVVITLLPAPVATTGGPQTICAGGTTASLGGNTPAAGETGTWSIVTAGVTGTFNPNANTPGATFTHISGGVGGTITLRWTVTNPTCGGSATADAIITVNQQQTATAGGPQTICAGSTTTGLGGNTPSSGTGTWTIVTGGATGTFNPNANTPNATFTPTSGAGTITLRWTISSPPCADSFAEVIITVKQQPTATAGGPQTICAGGTSAGLGGNTPTGGATGTWAIVTAGAAGTFNPNAGTPNATFTHTGGTGTITLRWTVSNPPCPNATADVAISITQPPTTATVGPNQTIVPGGTTAPLGGNTPSSGTGMWSIVTAGATGTFNPNASTPNATWTHATGSGQVVLRWTISNPPCPSSQADVTIQIGTPPTITCPTSPVVANTEPGQCSAHVTFTVTATGVPTPTVTCTPPSGSVFQKGNTTVNCTAANGVQPDATCSFTVTVNDMQPPSITCPANITQSTDPNLCTAVVSYVTPTASDNCPCGAAPVKSKPNVASCAVVCAPASGSTFQKGTTTVTCTATDTSGNQASCSFTVTVNDTQPPSITCPANITKSTDPNLCTAVVTYNAPGVSDNCPGVGTPVCNPASGSTFPKGTTTVTCNVGDMSGNQSSCSFTVTVNDTQPPSITCPANITIKTPQAGDPCVIVNYPPPVVTDNCPGATVVCTPPSGSCFPLGTTTVTCTATDTSSNTATCTFRVNVFDLCVQDDSDPTTVVLINSITGDYRFCCHGVTYIGRGTMTIRGSIYTLEHNPSDRRVLVKDDEGVHKASGSIQAPPGTTRCTIIDRNTLDNSCVCQ